jgi:ribosomal protein S18 acetylase RimI-like enzyme
MEIDIQEATQNHLPSLMPLITEFYQYFDYPFDYQQHSTLVADFLNNPNLGKIWLINYQSKFVGYLALTYGFTFEYLGRDAFVDEFYIQAEYRSLGIGKIALNKVQQLAKSLGLNALHLHTEKYNPRAKELYEKLGFVDKQRSTLTWLSDSASIL